MTRPWAGSGVVVTAGRRLPAGRSAELAVAVLVLLAAAAGARVVAADLGTGGQRHGTGALDLLGLLVGAVTAGGLVLELGLAQLGLGLGALLRLQRGDLLVAADAHAGQQDDDLALDVLQHLGEQLEGFALVFLLGLLLRVAAQMDALAQVVHARQVLL